MIDSFHVCNPSANPLPVVNKGLRLGHDTQWQLRPENRTIFPPINELNVVQSYSPICGSTRHIDEKEDEIAASRQGGGCSAFPRNLADATNLDIPDESHPRAALPVSPTRPTPARCCRGSGDYRKNGSANRRGTCRGRLFGHHQRGSLQPVLGQLKTSTATSFRDTAYDRRPSGAAKPWRLAIRSREARLHDVARQRQATGTHFERHLANNPTEVDFARIAA